MDNKKSCGTVRGWVGQLFFCNLFPSSLVYIDVYKRQLEYHVEMTWYNKEIFEQYNLTPPTTMDEWLNVCKTLKDNGITPISVDGVDRWPVQRLSLIHI